MKDFLKLNTYLALVLGTFLSCVAMYTKNCIEITPISYKVGSAVCSPSK